MSTEGAEAAMGLQRTSVMSIPFVILIARASHYYYIFIRHSQKESCDFPISGHCKRGYVNPLHLSVFPMFAYFVPVI